MNLTEQEVKHVALLGRLALSGQEITTFSQQLNSILGHIDKLNELDTRDVEPTSHAIPMANKYREDAVQPSLDPEKVLANAPQRIGDAFGVPKVVE